MTTALASAVVAPPPALAILAMLALERRRFERQRDHIAKAAEVPAAVASTPWQSIPADKLG
jgi:hypothetical protein